MKLFRGIAGTISNMLYRDGTPVRIEAADELMTRVTEAERILAERDAAPAEEVKRLKEEFGQIQGNQALLIRDYQARLSAANAAIAMQSEAANKLLSALALYHVGENLNEIFALGAYLRAAIYPESLAAWEAEKKAKWLEQRKAELLDMLRLDDSSAVRMPAGIELVIMTMVEPLRNQVAMLRHLLDESWQEKYLNGVELRERCNHALANTQATAEAYEREVEARGAVKVLEELLTCDDMTNTGYIHKSAIARRATTKKE